MEIWINHDCESSDVPTWSTTRHPSVWPWVDLMFCSSRRHINRGIIPLMLKLSFVHILLASTWVADTADKWVFFFLPTTPSNQQINQSYKPKQQRWLLQYGICAHDIWAGSNIWEGISPSGMKRRSKICTCTLYCNWWPTSVLSNLWLAAAGTKKNKKKKTLRLSDRHLSDLPINDEFVLMFTADLWSLTCLGMDFWCNPKLNLCFCGDAG